MYGSRRIQPRSSSWRTRSDRAERESLSAVVGKSKGSGPARIGGASFALLGRRLAPWALLVPSGLFLGLMVAASLMMLRISFGAKNAEFDVWILGNYVKLTDTLYWKSIVVTLKLAFFSAVLVVLLGFPIAMFMARVRTEALRRIVLFAILLPLLMNLLLQSFGWLVLLAPTGLFNQILHSLGMADGPILLIFNQTGVLLALVQTAIPLAVLPMAGAIRMIPASVEEAAATLGANRLQVLWHVVLPLSLPGSSLPRSSSSRSMRAPSLSRCCSAVFGCGWLRS